MRPEQPSNKPPSARAISDALIASMSPDEWICAKEVAVRGCDGRIDVLAVRKRQYLQRQLRAYEVKISRTDFLADIGAQKWRKYLSVCHQVYFVTPQGLVKREEIPAGAGLVTITPTGPCVAKVAPIHEPQNLDADAVLSALFAVSRDYDARALTIRENRADILMGLPGAKKKLGQEISRRLNGASPTIEQDAARLMAEVSKLFPTVKDAIKALKFAHALNENRATLEHAAFFLSDLANLVRDPEESGRIFLTNERKTRKAREKKAV